eukprot:2428788-Prymnesium_polylepis.4
MPWIRAGRAHRALPHVRRPAQTWHSGGDDGGNSRTDVASGAGGGCSGEGGESTGGRGSSPASSGGVWLRLCAEGNTKRACNIAIWTLAVVSHVSRACVATASALALGSTSTCRLAASSYHSTLNVSAAILNVECTGAQTRNVYIPGGTA